MTAPIRTIRHAPFGPHAIAVAQFLRDIGLVPADDIIGLVAELDRRWPQLSAHDLHGAVMLAQALALEPRGRA